MNRNSLYEFVTSMESIPLGLPLIAGLDGFTDAGGSIAQTKISIFSNLESQEVIRFNADELIDYRARRPVMLFEKDHITEYQQPELSIHLVQDEAGQSFLYLTGYEPDFRWESFASAICNIVKDLEISEFLWVHSIPFPVPHTRALSVTVSGNRRDMIDRFSQWRPETHVPGNILHLLEFELSKRNLPCTGFVLLVPHYLGDSNYPVVAIKAFELLSAATGLVFITDDLREAETSFDNQLQQQLSQNQELARMVENLESGYQNSTLGLSPRVTPAAESEMPSADEIASALEDYLAAKSRNEEESD